MNNHNPLIHEASSSHVATPVLEISTPMETDSLEPPAPLLEFRKNCSNVKETRIMLTWRFLKRTATNIIGYELFVGLMKGVGITGNVDWRKIGDIEAVPLPALCILNNFIKYGVYCFKIRAIDVHKRNGAFSCPVYIRKIHPDPSLPLDCLHPDVRAGVIEISESEMKRLSYSDCINLYNKNEYLNEVSSSQFAATLKREPQEEIPGDRSNEGSSIQFAAPLKREPQEEMLGDKSNAVSSSQFSTTLKREPQEEIPRYKSKAVSSSQFAAPLKREPQEEIPGDKSNEVSLSQFAAPVKREPQEEISGYKSNAVSSSQFAAPLKREPQEKIPRYKSNAVSSNQFAAPLKREPQEEIPGARSRTTLDPIDNNWTAKGLILRFPYFPNPSILRNASPEPPAPSLFYGKVCREGGRLAIMLIWKFSGVAPRNIIGYELFYNHIGSNQWKKTQDIGAVPLPVACYIVNFRPGVYAFIVRAVNSENRRGAFSSCVFAKICRRNPSL